MSQTMIQSLADYFLDCPLTTGGTITVDFLPETKMEYSVNTSPASEIVKRYADDSSVRFYPFFLRSVKEYDLDILQKLSDCGFFENLSDWLDAQSRTGNLPLLPEGKIPQKIEALSTGYVLTTESATTAKFEIQCRLQYFQEG